MNVQCVRRNRERLRAQCSPLWAQDVPIASAGTKPMAMRARPKRRSSSMAVAAGQPGSRSAGGTRVVVQSRARPAALYMSRRVVAGGTCWGGARTQSINDRWPAPCRAQWLPDRCHSDGGARPERLRRCGWQTLPSCWQAMRARRTDARRLLNGNGEGDAGGAEAVSAAAPRT